MNMWNKASTQDIRKADFLDFDANKLSLSTQSKQNISNMCITKSFQFYI